MDIEGGQWLASRDDARACQSRQQSPEFRLHFEDGPSAAFGHQWDVAAELKCVAKALLGMHQDGLACDIVRAAPQRLRKIPLGARQRFVFPSPFVFFPSALELARQ